MDLLQLRELLRRALTQNNHTLAQAATLMGTSQPQLTRFLNALIDPSAELTIRLAHYLRLPHLTALQLAGHTDFAAMLNTIPLPTPYGPNAQRFATLTATATPSQIDLALQITALIVSGKWKVESSKC